MNGINCLLEQRAEFISGNIYIRPVFLEKEGQMVGGHTHNFDHTCIVIKGAVNASFVTPDGITVEKDFVAPDYFLVDREVAHTIIAQEDNTVFWCVYSHRTPQGEISQERTGWEGVYI